MLPLLRTLVRGAAIIVAASCAAWAGAPNVLTYQGQLSESGAAVSGTRDVLISLCPTPTGDLSGTCLPTVRQTVSVVSGVFRSTYSLPGGVDLARGFWWLDVQEGPQGGALRELLPREQLTGSAYVLHASSASILLAAPGLGGIVISSAVSIGTAAPTAMLDVQGSAYLRSNIQLGFSASLSTCTAAQAGSLQWTANHMQLCDGMNWRALPRLSSCHVESCPQTIINNHAGNCFCQANNYLMLTAGSSGWYYSVPTQIPTYGMAWYVSVTLPVTQGITPDVDIVCCPY